MEKNKGGRPKKEVPDKELEFLQSMLDYHDDYGYIGFTDIHKKMGGISVHNVPKYLRSLIKKRLVEKKVEDVKVRLKGRPKNTYRLIRNIETYKRLFVYFYEEGNINSFLSSKYHKSNYSNAFFQFKHYIDKIFLDADKKMDEKRKEEYADVKKYLFNKLDSSNEVIKSANLFYYYSKDKQRFKMTIYELKKPFKEENIAPDHFQRLLFLSARTMDAFDELFNKGTKKANLTPLAKDYVRLLEWNGLHYIMNESKNINSEFKEFMQNFDSITYQWKPFLETSYGKEAFNRFLKEYEEAKLNYRKKSFHQKQEGIINGLKLLDKKQQEER